MSKSHENASKKSVAIQSSKGSVVTKSSVSRRSQSSKGSKASSKLSAAISLSLAKAEAAAAKLEYAELEAGLKKKEAKLLEEENFSIASAARKKAELHADLQLLTEKKEAAGAAAEALAFERFESNQSDAECSLFETAENLSLIDPAERTKEYVKQQIEHNAQQSLFHPTHMVKVEDGHIELAQTYSHPSPFMQADESARYEPTQTQPSKPFVPPGLDANRPPFEPRGSLGPQVSNRNCLNPEPQQFNASVSQPVSSELTRFLLSFVSF